MTTCWIFCAGWGVGEGDAVAVGTAVSVGFGVGVGRGVGVRCAVGVALGVGWPCGEDVATGTTRWVVAGVLPEPPPHADNDAASDSTPAAVRRVRIAPVVRSAARRNLPFGTALASSGY